MNIEVTAQSATLALTGGLVIGFAAALLLLFNGRVAGIAGIARRLFNFQSLEKSWKLAFVLGLLAGGFLFRAIMPETFALAPEIPTWRLIVSGLLVGFGSALGNGCTSGHGICGISRFSKRSIVATLSFMTTGFITVFVLRLTGAF